jgi:hypothetical protein
MFSKNTKDVEKQKFMEVLELTQESVNAKYLGLPVYMGRSKASLFCLFKGTSMETYTRLEVEITI